MFNLGSPEMDAIPQHEVDRHHLQLSEHQLSSTECLEQTTIKLEPIFDGLSSIDGLNSNKLYSNLPDGGITVSTAQLPKNNVYFIMPPQFMKLEPPLNQNEKMASFTAEPFVLDSEYERDESIIKTFQLSGELFLPAKQDRELMTHADLAMVKAGKK